MKTKFYSLTVALFLIAGGLFAQNNVVKIKPVRLGLKQLSLEYERVIIPKLTASLNFTYHPLRQFHPPHQFLLLHQHH